MTTAETPPGRTSPRLRTSGQRVPFSPNAVRVGRHDLGVGHPVYVVAEMSGNHGHDFRKARALVEAARRAGADAIKIQTYTADTLTIPCRNRHFRIKGTLWHGRTLHDLYGEAYTPWDWQPRLQAHARKLGLDFFSTPFDPTAVNFLEKMNVPAHKVASFELVDLSLLRCVAATGRPVILSTGMADENEIREAVAAIRSTGNRKIILLKCTSAYPADAAEMNLRTIPDMAARFGCPVGLSDHTLGIAVPIAAVTLGACLIEKHFTLRRSDGGPDAAFSLEPEEFRQMVEAIRTTERALGRAAYGPTKAEAASMAFRRSLFAVQAVAKGERFSAANVRSIRPGHGLAPKHLPEILGCYATRNIALGTPLSWDLLSKQPV
jgi:N-acetylneuraminate synthase